MINESCKELAVPWKQVDLGEWIFMPLQGQRTLWKQNEIPISCEQDVFWLFSRLFDQERCIVNGF